MRWRFGIIASPAEFERTLIAERVKSGRTRAQAQRKHVGSAADPAVGGKLRPP